jgi:hypothetical protein
MAIQLNDRDYQIFKLLDEHQVLLEKHISWFVASEDKPVLIRDRLRKLFYLDYLICQRHDDKLPWWTTPTKPLVYMLAPLARTVSGAIQQEGDFYDNDWQRDHLEIANIRMIFLIAKKEGYLNRFEWKTFSDDNKQEQVYSAIISATCESANYNIGLISHPQISNSFSLELEQELNKKTISHIIIVSRDLAHQENLQYALKSLQNHPHVNSILLATHQDLYKLGIAKMRWHNIFGQQINFLVTSSLSKSNINFGTIEAA